jgi:hypothetical protein
MSNKVSVLTVDGRISFPGGKQPGHAGSFTEKRRGLSRDFDGKGDPADQIANIGRQKTGHWPVFLDWVGRFTPCGFSLGAAVSLPPPQVTLLAPGEGVAFFHGSHASENPKSKKPTIRSVL